MARTPSARLRSEREEEQSPLFPLQCLLSYPRTRGGPAPINQKDLDMRLRFEARFSAALAGEFRGQHTQLRRHWERPFLPRRPRRGPKAPGGGRGRLSQRAGGLYPRGHARRLGGNAEQSRDDTQVFGSVAQGCQRSCRGKGSCIVGARNCA